MKAINPKRSEKITIELFLSTLYWLLVSVLCLTVLIMFFQFSGIHHYPSSLEMMVDGSAPRPFVYRVLLPSLVRAFSPLIPASYANQIGQIEFMALAIERIGASDLQQAVAGVALLFFFLMLFTIAMRLLMQDLGYSAKSSTWLPLILLASLSFLWNLEGKLYDYPALALFTLGVVFLQRGHWIKYISIFTLASMNKETSFLLILLFIVHYWQRLPKKEIIKWALIQTILYTSIRLWLSVVFADNEGSEALSHLQEFILAFRYLPFISFISLILLLLIISRIRDEWQEKPRILRQAVLVVGIPLLLLHLLFGFPFEIRVFLEVYPLVFLMVVWRIVKPIPKFDPAQEVYQTHGSFPNA